MFKDITPLLGHPASFRAACDALAEPFRGDGVTHVGAIESRGFLFGGPIALALNAAVVPIRKRGKLPYDSEYEEYQLEYGRDVLEMHRDAIHPGERILVIDDVLATGGTAAATCRLVEELDGLVAGLGFFIELVDLGGRARLGERPVESLATY